jgi:hypothetical protein
MLGSSGVGKTSVVNHCRRLHPPRETDTANCNPAAISNVGLLLPACLQPGLQIFAAAEIVECFAQLFNALGEEVTYAYYLDEKTGQD